MNIHPELAAGLKWGSHLPAIAACFSASIGTVIEVGVGHFSTPFLHALCAPASRELYSIEDDVEWARPFQDFYSTPSHHFLFGNYDELLPAFVDSHRMLPFGLAFIDNSPGGARRAKDLSVLLPVSRYVIVHDYMDENVEHIAPLIHGFEYHVLTRYAPPTLVVAGRGSQLPDILGSF